MRSWSTRHRERSMIGSELRPRILEKRATTVERTVQWEAAIRLTGRREVVVTPKTTTFMVASTQKTISTSFTPILIARSKEGILLEEKGVSANTNKMVEISTRQNKQAPKANKIDNKIKNSMHRHHSNSSRKMAKNSMMMIHLAVLSLIRALGTSEANVSQITTRSGTKIGRKVRRTLRMATTGGRNNQQSKACTLTLIGTHSSRIAIARKQIVKGERNVRRNLALTNQVLSLASRKKIAPTIKLMCGQNGSCSCNVRIYSRSIEVSKNRNFMDATIK